MEKDKQLHSNDQGCSAENIVTDFTFVHLPVETAGELVYDGRKPSDPFSLKRDRVGALSDPVSSAGYMPMLTWQKNSPHFVIDGNVGDVLILYFGSTNIDDIQISEFHFVIELLEHNGRWWLKAEWHQWCDQGHRPGVDSFISELNRAIEGRKDLDFHKHLDSWRRQDAEFRAIVRARL